MSHLSDETLALYAGGDLPLWQRWSARRHLAVCDRCRADVEVFDAARESAAALAELPDVPWNRIAADMKANIRLGLEAGECVRDREPARRPALSGTRAVIAYACMAVLVATGLMLEGPAPPAPRAKASQDVVLQVTGNGIELQQGGGAITLLHGSGSDVTYSVGAQGMMRARYVDAETGNVTINNVYVQ